MSRRPALLLSAVLLLGGCDGSHDAPMPTVAHVDLQRFMGPWYVIANIPTFIERNAHNAVERYQLAADGTIETHFTFRAGGFDGPSRSWNPRGFVLDRDSNARWGMQFVWPVKADYRILYVDAAYSLTVVGRQARDHVWIMARSPVIAEADYARLLRVVEANGYTAAQVQRVPQRWPPSWPQGDAPAEGAR